MRASVGYKTNLILASLKSRGLLKSAQRAYRKHYYAGKGLPTYIQIEITNRCNLSCPYCAASRDLMRGNGRDMSFDEFKKIADSVSSVRNYLPTIQLAFRGEPLLNKEAAKIAAYAAGGGFFVTANTNGILLDSRMNRDLVASGLSCLTISADGANKDTYESMRRGGDFDVLIRNIRDLIAQKKDAGCRTPFVELQCVVTRKTEAEIDDFVELGIGLGVNNIKFKTYKLTCLGRDADSVESLKVNLPERNEYSRYRVEGGRLVLKERPRACSWAHDCIIYSDGDMGPCCEDYNKSRIIGNVLRDGFWSVWNSKEAVELRDMIKKRALAMCKTCS